ncbi:MAG: hypothetical protein U0441_07390 [Polyangiaceae bacterium]
MPTNFVLWFGPVSSTQIKGATAFGATPHMVSCTGDGSDGTATCADRADGWKDGDGRRLPALLKKMAIDSNDINRLVLGAFSAGGQCLKRVCLHATDRQWISAVLLSDATYSIEWLDHKNGHVAPIEGFLRYAVDCLSDGRLFLATASASPNHDYPTGAQCLAGLKDGIEKETGLVFEDATGDPLWTGLHKPERAWRLKNVVFADFGLAYHHGEHPTVLAPILWPRALEMVAAAGGRTG